MAEKNKKVVVIGGGTGVFTVLSGLKKYPLDLSAIVSMADDGGSTGKLREEFGILPPGDVRRALVALSNADKHLSDLFNFRFDEGVLKGHNFGNLFIMALERMEGDFQKAVNLAGKLLGVEGKIIPVTLDNVKLVAKMENGEMVYGETNIDVPKHNGFLRIKEIFLKPSAKINPYAVDALKSADVIIIGPGDLFTSIVPNLLVKGMQKAISSSKAKKFYIVNLMTKFGETNKFKGSDFLSVLEKYLGKNVIDEVIINIGKPSFSRLKKYAEEHAEIVRSDIKLSRNLKIIKADLLRSKGFLRHDPDKLAKIIFQEI